MLPPPHVAILIVAHNGVAHLPDCLASAIASDDGPLIRHFIVVDNASTDATVPYLESTYPGVRLVHSPRNLGFAGGNNLGLALIRLHFPQTQYIALLNQDTIVRSGWLAALVNSMDGWPLIGATQARILLHPQTDRFNTAGNVSHFLGFGFTTGYLQRDTGQYSARRPIGFASGAAMLLRASSVDDQIFDGEYGNYLEDAQLSWSLRQRGYQVIYQPDAIVYHKYTFKRDYRNYFYLERNRWLLLATYYKMPTLLLLLPALIFMEAGQLYFAYTQGIATAKLRAWTYFLNRPALRSLTQKRESARHARRLPDREFLKPMTGTVNFPELTHPLLERLANPVLSAYWAIARKLIFW